MYKNVIKDRLSVLVVNGLLALMMVFGSFGAVNAQEAGNRILLPLVQAGSSVGQVVDGPFLDMPEPPVFDESQIDENLIESTPEISAAASCYGGFETTWSASIPSGQLREAGPLKTTSRCRDINIKPNYSGYVNVQYLDSSGVWHVKGWRPVSPNRWSTPMTNIRDGVSFYIYMYNSGATNRNYSVKLAY